MDEERPGVISINMQIAALGVTEMLARLHPFRDDPNREFAGITLCNSSMDLIHEPEGAPCRYFKPMVGRGDRAPLLGNPEFGKGDKI